MYYVILGVIFVLLFLLRKRIIGGIVGVVTLVLMIALSIFLFDFFYTGVDLFGNDRDVRNIEQTQEVVEQYDETVKDPAKKAQDIGDTIVNEGTKVNDQLKETGAGLDKKLGIEKDDSNNNLWGADEQAEQESENTEATKSEETEDSKQSGDEASETSKESMNTNKLSFGDLNKAEELWGISKEDANFVRSASPFNKGEFSNGSITIVVEEDGVTLR